ncbi:MAG TPA: MerR family transcriptional regulator [Anaerolineae bacterium]|nr:MerR family transcriptional regulator [Anaerolineae bacterium]
MYRIGELAKLAGINKSAIDHYTRLGLIEPAKRTGGSYRLYSQEALEKIEFINKCKKNRLSLAEIQEAMRGELSTERAEVNLCMTHASLAIDEALHQLNSIGVRLEGIPNPHINVVRNQAGLLMLKVLAIVELLQMLSQQV